MKYFPRHSFRRVLLCCRFRALALVCGLLAGCGGGGTDPPTSGALNVNVSGRVTFDRIPFKLTPGQGLDYANLNQLPVRGAVIEAIDPQGSVLATTVTDAMGHYSLSVPGNRELFIRAKAQMLAVGSSGASWNFRVLNNTNGSALYVLDGEPFNSGSGLTRDVHAPSGWNGAGYTGTRAAAPFAILDTVYQAKELLLTANPALALPSLDLFWSASNRPTGDFCPRLGWIGTTAYLESREDECMPTSVIASGIYILGDYAGGAGDTDEFDQSVLAHEFAHYIESMLGRTDSVGGQHNVGSRLDARVAMSEGWANAFSGMVLGSPIYRDSLGAGENSVDLEAGPDPTPGWFSESSVHQIIWDIFDPANEANDAIQLGYSPIHSTVLGAYRSTPALTTIHVFASGLKSQVPSAAAAVDALMTASSRNITGQGDFADGESNSGGLAITLPVYKSVTLNQPTAPLCSSATYGTFNRLGNRQFLRLDIASPLRATITVSAANGGPGSVMASDPDFVLWRDGTRVIVAQDAASSSETRPNIQLQRGTYVLEVYDFAYANPQSAPSSTLRCMTVSATG